MYNKIFTKILDSSIWMEPLPTRIVWLTFIAAMDENGFVSFASPANVAHRSIVPLDDTIKALATLEGPDVNSSDPENEGRRLEKVPGGWIVLNAHKYRTIVTKAIAQERTRDRVRAHRHKKANAVTVGNGAVTVSNESVTQSEAVSDARSKAKAEAEAKNEKTQKIGPSDEELDIASSKPLAKLPKPKLGLHELNSIPGLKVIAKDQQKLLAVLNEVGLDVLSQATRDCLKLAIPAYESNVTPIAYALLAQKSAPPPEKFEDWPEDLNELPDGHPAKRMAKPKAPETNQ